MYKMWVVAGPGGGCWRGGGGAGQTNCFMSECVNGMYV
jgi:hypothetical protein